MLRPRRTATSRIAIVIAPEPVMPATTPARRAERRPRLSTTRQGFAGGLSSNIPSNNPPVLSGPDDDAESSRGLILVNALSKEWSYFLPPGGGKVVYCTLETA